MARQMKTMDGNNAAAHVSYAFTEVAAIFPITPSSVMAEVTDVWSANGRTNVFGEKVRVAEMQSEGGAAGAVHGSLSAGALTTTYTASQGLLLMIPNMYKIAGELLPCVINVSARALASHALSIFGDHSDIYACRQTGFAFLCSGNVQETMDLGAVAHLSAIKGRVPFCHFFDGFRTSHEIQKIEAWDYKDLAEMLDWDSVKAFRERALNPEHPVLRGSAQNPDIFFQAREACNSYYDALPAIVEDYMDQVNKKIGTNYQLFNYYGAPDAEHVIIAMGSVCDTICETIDYLNAKGGKYGLVTVRLYRPFVAEKLVAAIPDTTKTLSVLDRTKEPGSIGEPLYLDVVLGIRESKFGQLPVFSGRYGLGSKDTTPAQIIAVFKNAEVGAKKRFTVGIEDDVTHLSLPITENPDTSPAGTTSCKFWGLGSDGTVGANKNSIKIIGDHTKMYAQAYFAYDSKKSGGVTVSHLRFGKSPIRSTYLINKADFVACHNSAYMSKYDMVSDLKPGGSFLLACSWNQEELEQHLPGDVKKYIADNNINFYTIDAVKIAKEIGLGNRLNTILQSAFFNLAKIIPIEEAVKYMKDAATKSYGKRGEEVVKMNHDAIDAGVNGAVKVNVPESWKSAKGGFDYPKAEGDNKALVDFVNNVMTPANAQKGDSLPVSALLSSVDGTLPQGTSAFEKRGVAVDVPQWMPENCIQCGFCSYVCPHATIRPIALNAEQAANAPADQKLVDMTGMPGYKFGITVSALDCMGCGSCAAICPGKKGEKALVMQPIETQLDSQKGFAYGYSVEFDNAVLDKFKADSVKGSQLRQPLLEFSGACAGCGETPYAKLVTQMFGDRMYIANATGCSSIWGGSAPSTPYTTNKKGKGPAWGNSLFEDNAEYGYGMFLGQKAIRDKLIAKVEALSETATGEVKAAADEYLATKNNATANGIATDKLVTALEKNKIGEEILKEKDYLSKKSIFIFGGDGWAYDIGYGGLDHVLAQGEDVNIVVFDTEVYSNTGGQSSKATPTGAVAQFAAAGKEVKKKDLAAIAMSYGYIYVAQCAMGADYAQTAKAISEAESYDGPSLVICYAPCINHGIKGGMSGAQAEIKNAVAAGYWHNFRFDPRLALAGKNPFMLDSKAPTADYEAFLRNEVRYSSLERIFPDRAQELFRKAAENAQAKYEALVERAK
ncbi:MAG: nifJ [Oscillospiraceae bacterium]|jgi:pyruvate-ferredoxin/flavodoxin oxidoreductase|nr:nifJ [Oscillospiraceae bacterium]